MALAHRKLMLAFTSGWLLIFEDDTYLKLVPTLFTYIMNGLMAQAADKVEIVYVFAISPVDLSPRQILGTTKAGGQSYQLLRTQRAYGTQCILMRKAAKQCALKYLDPPGCVLPSDIAVHAAVREGFVAGTVQQVGSSEKWATLIGHGGRKSRFT